MAPPPGLATGHFTVVVGSLQDDSCRNRLTGPALRAPNYWFTHHSLLTQEARELEMGKATLGGLINANCL